MNPGARKLPPGPLDVAPALAGARDAANVLSAWSEAEAEDRWICAAAWGRLTADTLSQIWASPPQRWWPVFEQAWNDAATLSLRSTVALNMHLSEMAGQIAESQHGLWAAAAACWLPTKQR